ncbi:PREDICTED: uncharacterized protein LOC108378486 [Rhagoletis zephyria]|uniref:uncharacterized protein LOC108378486 n=1 Tax=Rhagoletis zephyria TaxID=28612 RepID=UPI00081175C4|nr:PREDICTED: uncharacterized protein LOC108378486 [Rhagoletis zephyria]
MVEPQLQQELFPILLRFRMHRYAMSADIAKMYRQVYVHEKHVDFQRIVWRDAPTEELKDYGILRLTYGTPAASHLAVKALQQVARHKMTEFQSSAEIILRDFYMDDHLTGAHTADELVLHASEKAYAAVAYARTKYLDGKIVVNLVASRTKVAPLKSTTLPRLELCAAHLAAKLIKQITACLCSPESRMFGWTDCTVTLACLQGHPSRWSTFVANRVAEMQEILPSECWTHVRSESNPADLAYRGMSPSSLLSYKLWWHGPPWLSSSSYVPHEVKRQDHTTQLEMRKKTAAVNVAEPSQHWTLLAKFSSFSKLKRVTAYVMRFIDNVRNCAQTMPRKQTGPLTSKEIQVAELKLISAKKPLPRRISLLRLQPFVDKSGILRVGGRLKHSNVASDVKHPVILAKSSPLAKLIVADIHKFTLHAGPRIMQALLGCWCTQLNS